MYALCTKCGHGDSYWGRTSGSFTVFSPKADISKMTIREFADSGLESKDLEIECLKCGSTEVQTMRWPPPGMKKT